MDTFIEEMVALPHSQEIHVILRYGEWGAEKATLWFEYRSGQLKMIQHEPLPEEFPELSLVSMLVLQKLAETFYRQKKEDRASEKKIEESFTVPVDFVPEA